jgi:hypothetical protein
MKSIWVRPDGYWWTQVSNDHNGNLLAWLVPVSFEAPNQPPLGWTPGEDAIAFDRRDGTNDTDNDLLADSWELGFFSALAYDRYDDLEGDLADSLEEFLAGTDPTLPSNDSDGDDLPDTWEYRYFGTLDYSWGDDPDADGLDNESELSLGIHPGRAAVDRDRDGLPDTWESFWFKSLEADPGDDPNEDGYTNLEAYELGIEPVPLPIPVPSVSQSGLISMGVLLVAIGAVILRKREWDHSKV